MLKRLRPEHARAKLWAIILAAVIVLGGGWAAKTYLIDGAKPRNILLLGVDENKTRTDVMMLAHIDPRHKIFNVISIPRDTLVDIDCSSAKDENCITPDKLNHAHVYGGPELTVKAVEDLLDVKIDGYVRVDFDGFETLVDKLGGVDIVIEEDMYYRDPTAGLEINFEGSPQPQHLDGTEALKYVRFRNETGDIGRTERTRKFLIALVRTLRQNGTITRLPGLATSFLPYVKTNLDTGAMASMARVAPDVSPDLIEVAVIPGEAGDSRGLWVWIADEAKTRELVDRLVR